MEHQNKPYFAVGKISSLFNFQHNLSRTLNAAWQALYLAYNIQIYVICHWLIDQTNDYVLQSSLIT